MIYLDHASTTKIHPQVFQAMKPYLSEAFGNPSSSYDHALKAKEALEFARNQTASVLSVPPETIHFTCGGTEADNWALLGTARMLSKKGQHIITSNIEHHAILHTAKYLEQIGFDVTYLPADEQGFIHPSALEAAIRPDTILISIMFANNEIGTIQPIKELCAIAKRHHILFHTDAVQAFGQIPIDANALGIDMLSASSHKLYGPKGSGCLYLRENIPLPPLLFGGGQENGIRAGTENVPGIVGFGMACQLAKEEMKEVSSGEIRLRNYLIHQVLTRIPYSRLNGSLKKRLPGNASFSFQFAHGASLLLMLDMKGICASAGSACSASSPHPSHVLKAIGLPDELAYGTLRLTLGRSTTKEEIDTAVDSLEEILANLRDISDDYNRIIRRVNSFENSFRNTHQS